jgi:hypothetical protein
MINIIVGEKALNSDFLKLSDFSDQSSNVQLLNDVILYHYFMQTPLFDNNMIGLDYFKNLDFIFEICKHMYVDILKTASKHNHLIILSPGDSPSYFMFIIKMLFPEILLNEKITIVEFPISKLGTASRSNINITKYLDFIINNHVDKSILNVEHNYLIFDYNESGDSTNYLISNLKKLYNIELKDDFTTIFNISNYFIDLYDIDFNSKKKKIIKKKGEEYWDSNKYTYIKDFFEKNISNYSNDLIDFPNQDIILRYFVDDDYDKRCQYKMTAFDANEFICQLQIKNNSIDFKDFVGSKLNPAQLSQLYSSCNNLLYFIYMYYTFPDKVIEAVTKIHGYLNKKILEDFIESTNININMECYLESRKLSINGTFKFKIKKGLIKIYNKQVEKIYLEITDEMGMTKIFHFKDIIIFKLNN